MFILGVDRHSLEIHMMTSTKSSSAGQLHVNNGNNAMDKTLKTLFLPQDREALILLDFVHVNRSVVWIVDNESKILWQHQAMV